MGIKYDGLFKLLKEKNISKTQLKSRLGFSSTTIAKLAKNELVSMKVIEDICKELSCQPGDIIMMEKEQVPNRLLEFLQEEKKMKLKGGIYHTTQIKFAYNSNHIEGSKLSEDQTRYIYETNTIESDKNEPTNVDDIIETINHFQCFDYMLDHVNETISEEIIKQFHKILKANTSDSRKEWFNVGDYKSRTNVVGDNKTTMPAKVKGEMAKLIIDYNGKKEITFQDIVEFHYNFESIHPFQDGNGQVGRLIMFKECLKNNITPSITDTCLSAQDKYDEMVKYFIINE